MNKQKIETKVIETIIKNMEKGNIPWKKPWSTTVLPQNLVSRKAYTGINSLVLGSFQHEKPYYLTFKQVKELGGNVKKGSKGIPVVYFAMLKDKKNPDKTFPMMKYYNVFHCLDTEGIEEKIPSDIVGNGVSHIAQVDSTIREYLDHNDIKFQQKENRAYYNSKMDLINLPLKESFHSTNGYYATLFHECIHSTGHASRLNREMGNTFGDHAYSFEELIAELGSSLLCQEFGIDNEENSTAYLQSWLKTFKNDPTFLFKALPLAKKAYTKILPNKPS